MTEDEFRRLLTEAGHTPAEVERLWRELTTQTPARAGRRLDVGPTIAVTLGSLLVVAAVAAFLGTNWERLDPWGVLATGLVMVVAALGASERLRRGGLDLPAGLLAAIGVGFTAVVAYGVEEAAGIWPEGASDPDHIHRGITGLGLVLLVATLLVMVVRPHPLVLVPLGGATALLGADVAEVLFGNDASGRQRFVLVLVVGAAWIAAGLRLDVRKRRTTATWVHWVGVVICVPALTAVLPTTIPGWTALGLIGAVSLLFSAFVGHWSFAVAGAAAVLASLSGALSELGGLAPLIVAGAGLLFLIGGLRWTRWREPLRTATLAHLPSGIRSFVERLAP
jgi:hypothetical protein